ncbi:MAG: hypothetical protein HYX93_03605 [Chloroflexi bacterium]|nr:hypothetical protein [Chloroflexota bacterium]
MRVGQRPGSALAGPRINPEFAKALDELVAVSKQGYRRDSDLFNPSDQWLISHMRIFQDLPPEERKRILQEASQITQEAERLNAEGKAASRAWPDAAVRLNSGGVAFFSQLGVARRPDLTQYFIDGFPRNRDAIAFSEESQALFAEVFPYITKAMRRSFEAGTTVVQTDRGIGDVPGRSFHARQLLFGTRYMQLPYMWRQLTFPLPDNELGQEPDILEVSIPHWLDDLNLPEHLKERIQESGLTRLVFKAPTRGLSLHLGFDYVGEHKMGPLSIAMFNVKQAKGLALQAALSMAHVRTLDRTMTNTAIVTTGPSLHGKSTLTVMLELSRDGLARLMGAPAGPDEGIYPMNDDIVLLQPMPQPVETTRGRMVVRIPYGIYGTENSFYAVPFGLTREDDPITYDVLRGTDDAPNPQETLENVPVNVEDGKDGVPDFLHNPVRNMRMVLSRSGLLERKGVSRLLGEITGGHERDAVHIPMENTDRLFWQGVMRQNTVVPPLVRLTPRQYIRGLMYGEAIQTGAAAGAIGRPYVEYFSDPFIIGLEDENANVLYSILQEIAHGGLPQRFYVFNTGGLGADSNEQASGEKYKKIPRGLTLTLQESLLRDAVSFEHDPILGVDVAVAIVDRRGVEVMDLREEWLPREIYGEPEYRRRVQDLKRKRYYGDHEEDKAGILRYTKATNDIFDIEDVPMPSTERELAWLLSFYWSVDQAYGSLEKLVEHLGEGERPGEKLLQALEEKYGKGMKEGIELSESGRKALAALGISTRG